MCRFESCQAHGMKKELTRVGSFFGSKGSKGFKSRFALVQEFKGFKRFQVALCAGSIVQRVQLLRLRWGTSYGTAEVAVLQDDVESIHRRITCFGLAHVDIAEGDIVKGFRLCALQHYGSCAGAIAGYILDVNIMNICEVMVVCSLACVHRSNIKEVFYVAKLATVEIDVVYESSTIRIGLDVKSALYVACIVAILHKHVTHSCTHLRTYHHTMKSLEVTIPYYYIL